MKKYLSIMFIAIAAMVTFSACSKDEDDNVLNVKKNVSIKVGEKCQITTNDGVDLYSNEDFVAPAFKGGYTQGFHVGKAIITVKKGESTAMCEVNVIPTYEIYEEPILEWGASKEYIKTHESRVYHSSATNNGIDFIFYTNPMGKEKSVAYAFKGGKLMSVTVSLERRYAANFNEFINERYQYGTYESGMQCYAHISGKIAKENIDYLVFVKSLSEGYEIMYMGKDSYE